MADCKTITFRPTPEFAQHIEVLMKRWKCKRTQAILKAVEIAARGPEINADNDRGSAATARSRLNDPEFLKIDPARNESRLRRLEKSLSHGVVDPAKLAAFQEKAGMTHYGKKR